jgi:hypothetical protein
MMLHNIGGISQNVQYQGCVIPISWDLKMNELKNLAVRLVNTLTSKRLCWTILIYEHLKISLPN